MVTYLSGGRIQGITSGVASADAEDDFSGSDNWLDTSDDKVSVNTSTDVLDFNIQRNSSWACATLDLQNGTYGIGSNASDTAWVLRWKMSFTTHSPQNGGALMWIGLTEHPSSTNIDQSGDSIVLRWFNKSDPWYQLDGGTSNMNNQYGTHATLATYATSTTYYNEIARTGDSVTATTWSGSYGGTVMNTQTRSYSGASPADLRYIRVSNYGNDTDGSAGLIGTIDDVEFWNNTSNRLKDEKATITTAGVDGSWSAGGDLGSAVSGCASGGNSSDAIVMGGYAGSNSGITTTQEYDGSSWTAGGNLLAQGGDTSGGGSTTDAIIATAKHLGGNVVDFCQTYNGSAWADGGNPNTDRHNTAGDGNSTDAIIVGGSPSQCETYNGTSWTDIAEITGREGMAAGGNSTSAICMGATVKTETWNGTAWADGGDMTQAQAGNRGGGLPTDAITIGGSTDNDMVEKYNGTAWAVVDLLSTGRDSCGAKGNNLNAFCAGGNSGGVSTEERTSTAPTSDLPTGTRFEETDTRKIFRMKAGAWVEKGTA